MLPKVMRAYHELGYTIDLGNPTRVYSMIVDEKAHKTLNVSGGMTISDAFLFMQIERVFKPESIFIIGNSFGLSTFVLAELFPNAKIDAIDAEIEGINVGMGTQITRQIAAKHFPNVQVTVGFSPQDLAKATTHAPYGLIFVDGMHTNEQMLLDYAGMLPYAAQECVFVFHDVGFAHMLPSWEKITAEAAPLGFCGSTMAYTQLGTCVLARASQPVLDYLGALSSPFVGAYRTGAKSDEEGAYPKRPFFWDMSFSHIESIVRRKFRRIVGLSAK